MKTAAARTALVLALLALGCGLASAQRNDRDGRDDRPHRGMVYDTRYHHNHYYPSVGFYAASLPVAALAVGFGRDRFWFNSGVWYRPYGGGYRVVLPPFGAVVPLLPPDYVTVRLGGLPYFYANGVYYAAYDAGPGYVVVAPPAGIENAQAVVQAPAVTPARADPIIYPRKNQSPEQTEADRQDCNRWATTQPAAMNSASVFSRAVEACMDGRGYTTK
jgi:hypothetical protein